MTRIAGREVLSSSTEPASGQLSPPRLLASGYQGAVYLSESPDGLIIVKRPLGHGIGRAVRRAMLRREHEIYQRLQGVSGIPRCFGLRHGEELLLEFIDGKSLRQLEGALPEREHFLAALLSVIEAMHRAGVAHGDLKRKDNILLGPDGQPYLIDFGTAVAAPPGAGLLQRLLFRQLRRMDFNAWIKLKYQRRLSEIEPADVQYHQPTGLEWLARVIRRAWRSLTFRRQRKARRGS
jgi:serine/threonine protein kinase